MLTDKTTASSAFIKCLETVCLNIFLMFLKRIWFWYNSSVQIPETHLLLFTMYLIILLKIEIFSSLEFQQLFYFIMVYKYLQSFTYNLINGTKKCNFI